MSGWKSRSLQRLNSFARTVQEQETAQAAETVLAADVALLSLPEEILTSIESYLSIILVVAKSSDFFKVYRLESIRLP